MNKMITWIMRNKLAVFLMVVVGWLVLRGGYGVNPLRQMGKSTSSVGMMRSDGFGAAGVAVGSMAEPMADMSFSEKSIMPRSPIEPHIAPTAGTNRLVLADTSMSIVVKDVRDGVTKIEAKAVELGGFLVDSNLNVPEGAASGSITVRVPEEKRSQALEEFRKLGVRVVSENVSGRDVTDEYVDLDARLKVVETTKLKFEQIMDQAVRIEDLLNVQRELVNLQSQIDSYKGQQKYLEQSAKLTRISVYLSTDELALPYAPDQVWRPQVVFKQAVRSLVGSFRGIANRVIWLVVFAPIWLPILLLVWWVRRVTHSTDSASSLRASSGQASKK